ncbi:response regulator [Cytobacillus oceanisediminis]|uniref:response regulator n=1 Tax=Cytobacillus oceanisediminis TaxID=665099 RepID=UPI00203D2214|nr:response regulator [Cytobacillus oceanisediminis]MCM3404930.1 response regulator [Cytobacillus oceanisediminis]
MINKVLIADDSTFMRQLLRRTLAKGNYQVIAEASDGCEAISLFKEVSPDIVLLDLTMPCKDGLSVLKEIKILDPNAIVVICSSMGQSKIIVEALNYGARDFIVKPNFNELIPTLNNLVC